MFEELPGDYTDKVGLPFAKRDLTDDQVLQIFGTGVKTSAANHLLRVLHGRRIAGTLEDPAYAINTMQFSQAQKDKALAYLRKTEPVEEVRSAGLRAQQELLQMEAEDKKANKEREKKRRIKEKQRKIEAGELNPLEAIHADFEYTPDPVYGHSVLEEFLAQKLANDAREKAREAAIERERREKELRDGVVAGPLTKWDALSGSAQRAVTNPKIQEYWLAAQSDLTEPPKMRPARRILPSVVFTTILLGIMAAVSMVYEEPAERYRLIPAISSADATIATLAAANLVVYLAWRMPPMWKIMVRGFLVDIATPRSVTMLTAVFSHQSLSHLVVNMLPLLALGPALHEDLGRAKFVTLLVACGSVGFTTSLATYTLRGMLATSTLGASGAVLGLCAAYFWAHRLDGFQLFGVPEGGVHGIVFLAILAALQLTALGKTVSKRVDVASHVGGMLTGMGAMELMQRLSGEKKKKVKKEEEKKKTEMTETTTGEGVAGEDAQVKAAAPRRNLVELWFWLEPLMEPLLKMQAKWNERDEEEDEEEEEAKKEEKEKL